MRTRSADFQSAVSQNCILLAPRPFHDREKFRRSADWKSAIQQIANLRYIILAFLLLCGSAMLALADGMLPIDKNGRALNLDFEDGTLRDWVAEGQAFEKQPIKGDTVAARRGDMQSDHQGSYWIGTYEIAGDKPQGTLTSVAFKVTQPYAAFRV